MNRIMNFKNERKALWEKAKAFLDRNLDPKTGMVSADAVQQYDRMVAQIKRLGDEIKRLEDQQEIERQINGNYDGISADFVDSATTIGASASKSSVDNGGAMASHFSSKAYSAAFSDMVRGQGNFPDVMDALSIGVDSEGGYTVSDEFDKKLVKGLEDHNVIRRISKVIRTESGTHKIPILAGKAAVGWVDESTPIPETDLEFDRITLEAFKLGAIIKASNEFLRDTAFDVEDFIADSFSLAIGAKEEDAFLKGTGVKMPTGLLHDTDGAGIGVTTENAGDVSFDDVIRLYYSLGAPYRKDAVFLCNEDLLMKLMLLKDKNDNYIWKPSLEIGKPDTILGKPVYTTTAMPEMKAGNKALLFGDFSYYWIADRGRRTFRRLDERYSVQDQVGFMVTQRVDGKLILKDAMKAMQVKA